MLNKHLATEYSLNLDSYPNKRFRVQVGIRSVLRELPDDVSQAELETIVRDLCADDAIDGLLVQLPLPPHIDEEAIIDVSALPVVVMRAEQAQESALDDAPAPS